MNHNEIQERLWAFYDNEIPAGDRSEILTHMESCTACREQLAAWGQTRDQILTPLRPQASEAFVHAVMRRVRSLEDIVRVPFFARWALPALAFSVASFAASLLYVMQPASASPEALLWADHSTNLSAQWLAAHPTEDQILNSVVTTR